MDLVVDEHRREILVAGEEEKVDLVVVDQRQTYNASCRVPVCMGCSLVLFSSEKSKLTGYFPVKCIYISFHLSSVAKHFFQLSLVTFWLYCSPYHDLLCKHKIFKFRKKICPNTSAGPIVAGRTYPNLAQRRLGRPIQPTNGPRHGVQRGCGY